MTIGHGPTPFMRSLRDRLLTDIVSIADGTNPPTLDPVTGQVAETGDVLYQGPALIRFDSDSRSSTEPTNRAVEQWQIRLPWNVSNVKENDVLTVEAVNCDPMLKGATLIVRQVHLEPWRTVRQIVCERG